MSNLEKAKELLQKEFDDAVISAIKTTLGIREKLIVKIDADRKEIQELDERLAELDTATTGTHYISQDIYNNKPTVVSKKDSTHQFPLVNPHLRDK